MGLQAQRLQRLAPKMHPIRTSPSTQVRLSLEAEMLSAHKQPSRMSASSEGDCKYVKKKQRQGQASPSS